MIQRGHESLVHHILLYQCSSSFNDSVLDYGHECYHPNMPDAFLTCETVIFAWAIGGEVGLMTDYGDVTLFTDHVFPLRFSYL